MNTFVNDLQEGPEIAMHADGRFMVAWKSSNQAVAGKAEVFGQLFAADGSKVGAEIQISSIQASNLYYGAGAWDVAALADGGYVVVYSGYSPYNLYAQRYAADGTANGAVTMVHGTSNNSNPHIPRVVALPGGGYTVVYRVVNNFSYTLFIRSYDAAGSALGPAMDCQAGTGSLLFPDPHVAVNASGDMVVAFVLGETTTDVYARRLTTTGVDGTRFKLAGTSSGIQSHPRVAIAPDGSIVGTWRSDHSGSNRVYYRRFDATGTAISDETLVTTYPGQNGPQNIAMDPTGAFAIAWAENGGAMPAIGGDAWARRFLADGTPAGEVVRVNTFTTGEQSQVDLALTPFGGIVVWRDARQEWMGSSSNGISSGIYAHRF